MKNRIPMLKVKIRSLAYETAQLAFFDYMMDVPEAYGTEVMGSE
jgi:hypothetical protein